MTETAPTGRPTDADLVAYLDGQSAADRRAWIAGWLARDGGLRERLTLLAGGGRPFAEAFEPLLVEAPQARLADMLASLPGGRPGIAAEKRVASIWLRPALLAAAIALFVAGAAADRLLPRSTGAFGIEAAGDGEDDWRQAAALYLSLYTSETLASIPDDVAPRERELATVGAKLGIALPLPLVSLPGLALKRAQLLQYDGKPLGQIAYLDPRNGALALCIFGDDRADAAPMTERRVGLNIVHWSSHGHAFMLIGRAEMSQLQSLAGHLSRELTL
ncbi:MAG: anti-sigma factor [Hyphomicrobiales bacterium]